MNTSVSSHASVALSKAYTHTAPVVDETDRVVPWVVGFRVVLDSVDMCVVVPPVVGFVVVLDSVDICVVVPSVVGLKVVPDSVVITVVLTSVVPMTVAVDTVVAWVVEIAVNNNKKHGKIVCHTITANDMYL